MNVILINPRIAVQKKDFLGSGIPYWPLEAVIFATHLKNLNNNVEFIDLFGEASWDFEEKDTYYLQGANPQQHLNSDRLQDVDLIVLYSLSYMSHQDLLDLTILIKKNSKAKVAILENSQAVTAYAIDKVKESFFETGVDFLICGEACQQWRKIQAWMETNGSSPDNVIVPEDTPGKIPSRIVTDEFTYPIPDWGMIPFKNYWKLPYSHGPKTKRFFPILTSRGCPWPCDFCVVPTTNQRKFRPRDAKDVVDEIIYLRDKFKVYDFQIEDLNPTVDSQRWRQISEFLIAQNAGIRFYFVSGTKAESLPLDLIPTLRQAGLRYVSISPESGSTRLMKLIGKKFNYNYAMKLVETCHKEKVRTQACFLIGHPDENEFDFMESKKYLRKLLNAGLDEAAVFMVAPFAGSSLYASGAIPIENDNALPSFSPRGRRDFKKMDARRRELIRVFFKGKLKQGLALWMQGLRALFGTPQTKMENLPKRMVFLKWRTSKICQWLRVCL